MNGTKLDVIASYIGTWWSALVQIAFVPAYIHYLGIESYGIIGFYTTLQIWLLVLDFGLTPTLAREAARSRSGAVGDTSIKCLFYTVEALCAGLSVVMIAGVAAAAPFLGGHWFRLQRLSVREVTFAVALMGVVIGARWMSNLYRGGLQGLHMQVRLNGLVILFSTLRGAGVLLVLYIWSPTITAYFIYQAAVSVVETMAMRASVVRQLGGKRPAQWFQLSILKEHSRFAGGMTALTIIGIAFTQADKLILTRILPLAEFGYYAFAATIANGLLVFSGPLFNALSPRLAAKYAQDDKSGMRVIYYRGTELIAITAIPFTGILFFFGRDIIVSWSSNPVLAEMAWPYACLLAVGTTFYCIAHMPFALQLAAGWINLSIVLNLVALMIFIPAIFFSVQSFGAIAAAAAWAALNLVIFFVEVPIVHSRLMPGITVNWLVRCLLFPAAAAIALLLLARPAYAFLAPQMPKFFNLGLIGIIWILSVAAAASTTPVGKEVYSLSRRLLKG